MAWGYATKTQLDVLEWPTQAENKLVRSQHPRRQVHFTLPPHTTTMVNKQLASPFLELDDSMSVQSDCWDKEESDREGEEDTPTAAAVTVTGTELID